jgi:DNA repair exonuclease SbcCD ATPase subunit
MTLCKSNLMLIDESFLSFDTDHRTMIPEILKEILKRYAQVLVISHMDELNNMIKDRINIKKTNNVSKII